MKLWITIQRWFVNQRQKNYYHIFYCIEFHIWDYKILFIYRTNFWVLKILVVLFAWWDWHLFSRLTIHWNFDLDMFRGSIILFQSVLERWIGHIMNLKGCFCLIFWACENVTMVDIWKKQPQFHVMGRKCGQLV